MAFKEVRFPTDIAYGSRGGAGYRTTVSETQSGFESRNQDWSTTRHRYNAAYGTRTHAQLEAVLALFHAMRGRFHGFRFKDWLDYKSCAVDSTPAATDQQIGTGNGSAVAYQLAKLYSYGGETYSRTIAKPVAGSVLVAIQNIPDPRWTVNTTTGVVTFTANITATITAITKAASARVTTTASHGLSNGHTVHFSGVGGMTQINGLRGTVTVVDANNFDVSINSTAFSTYTSGGAVNTIPQTGEAVRAGYEFDVPVRFDVDQLDVSLDDWQLGAVDIPLVEVRV